MKILERYILSENFKPFIVSLIVVTFVMLLDRILDLMNLIIEKNLDFLTTTTIFGLSLPFMLALTIPMAILLATIMSFSRLSVDNELIAFKSCGINIYTLMRPTVIAAFFLSLFMIYFNNTILPETNHQLKNKMIEVGYRRPVTAIKPRVFNSLEKYTIYAKQRVGEELRGIMIYNHNGLKYPETITAKRGKIELSNNGNSLMATLYDGEMHTRDEQQPAKYQIRTFKKFVLNLPDLGYQLNQQGSSYRGDRELSSAAMQEKIEQNRKEIAQIRQSLKETESKLAENSQLSSRDVKKYKNSIRIKEDKIEARKRDIREYQVEIQKKYAIAFACLVFVLIGPPVGMMTRTNGVGMAFTVSSIVFILYYGALTLGEELADNGTISPVFAMWFADVLFAIIGVYLVITSVRESKFTRLDLLGEKIMKMLKLK
jgi:lipopolysaccharide export system permease protein